MTRAQLTGMVLTLAVLIGGCGAPKLEQGDANSVSADRDELAASLRSVEQLRDPAQAADIKHKVDRAIATLQAVGYMSKQLQVSADNPVVAAAAKELLSEIGQAIPGLVIGGATAPQGLDTDATRDYLRYRDRDPARALHTPTAEVVKQLGITVSGKQASAQIGTLHNQSLKDFLTSQAQLLRPVWPDLAAQLESIRSGLR